MHHVQEEEKRRNEFEEKIQEMQVGVDEDPGISIYWSEASILHACLALAGSPVPQGINPLESERAIKDWFANIVLDIAPNAHVNDYAYYQHITMSEYGRITNRLLSRGISVVWRDALENSQLTAGEMLSITREGSRNEATRLNFSPFI